MSHVLGAVYSELRTNRKHKIHENIAKYSNLPLIRNQWYFSWFIGKSTTKLTCKQTCTVLKSTCSLLVTSNCDNVISCVCHYGRFSHGAAHIFIQHPREVIPSRPLVTDYQLSFLAHINIPFSLTKLWSNNINFLWTSKQAITLTVTKHTDYELFDIDISD